MRARRWALGLTALGTVGASAAVVGLPGSASADDTRYNLEARGDAWYFEVNGDEIPASPKNDAGSLTAAAETTNSGGSRGFAGMPYFGNTVQTLPGTVNGVPNQFGAGQVQLPFAMLPGFVETTSGGTAEAEEDFGYGRVKSSSAPDAATSSAFYGAPPAIPAPNQQQTASAATESRGNAVSAVASGSSSGFVSGPLEVANSTAIASITQSVGRDAQIESKTFGRFSVNGQDFGFDQNGFRYAGQGQDSKEALAQANSALKNAGMQIDLAPVVSDKDASGKTTYTIGGLMITTTQTSPTGSGATFTVTYVLGRAKVGSAVANLGFASSGSTTAAGVGTSNTDGTAGSTGATTNGATTNGATTNDPTPAGLDTAALPADVAAQAGTVPADVATITDTGTLAPGTDGTQTVSSDTVRSLGFAAGPGQSGADSEWLYAMLILAGLGVLGGHFLFGRYAATAKGA